MKRPRSKQARRTIKLREILTECLDSDHFNGEVYDRTESQLRDLGEKQSGCDAIMETLTVVFDYCKEKNINAREAGIDLGMKKLAESFPDIKVNAKSESTMTSFSVGGQGNIVNVAEYIKDVTNQVNQTITQSTASDEAKSLVSQIGAQLEEIATKIDEAKAKEIARSLKTLSEEMASASPRRRWYELSIEGLKEAAQAVGDVGKPILEAAIKLGTILLAAYGAG